ncbi:stretch-activated Ca2+-permeable channel component-domain-containing protein [Dactylonectria estremocensis]|uniref:Stretch-activated Ca2+-permeable channel component-domain-containing protein n=1 Tax=Dactylonectria estremocensis TaxID=1079267 RepID=A0A9P9J622_9HYPO|nr:stretch-activated Ca2+-permeable channel component-domain-containing protein [Dactylonectria estremocensis]
MQLSPLQSRLVASLGASLVLFALYVLLFSPSFASATELPINHVVRVEQPSEQLAEPPLALSDGLDISYEPEFGAFDRSIIGRATADVNTLTNNAVEKLNLSPNNTQCYIFKKSAIFSRDEVAAQDTDDKGEEHELSRRAQSKKVYISVNTCMQPTLETRSGKKKQPEQLSLYVSTSVQCPGPSKDASKMKMIEFEEGAVMYSLNTTGDVYVGITAPNVTSNYSSLYNFEIAASLDEYYHSYSPQNNSQLLWMDSDSSSALLVTRNLTQHNNETEQFMTAELPYDIYFQNNNSTSLDGLRHSVCGLRRSSQFSSIVNNKNDSISSDSITTGMTTRGPGNLPKQQFLVVGLDSSSSYSGIIVKRANSNSTSSKSKRAESSIGGGGTVFQATQFETSSGTNCKVVTNLEFCNETQYAVPGNDKKYNNTELATIYDNYAKEMYANFEKVLMQISCEAPPQSLYSLARNCDDCRRAYKNWLCTVSIPRCEDFMSNGNFSVVRNVGQAFPNGTKLPSAQRNELSKTPAFNASRNSFIDKTIKPGPYKELLPCEDICYEVVQSCPAAIGFTCPQPGFASFDVSYGRRDKRSTTPSCNYPGEARTKTSSAATVLPGLMLLGALPLMTWLAL